jgi:type I restriction enzyme S subunit
MKSEWVTIPLGDVLTLQRGHDLPTQNRLSGEIPILGSSGITGFHNEAKATGPGVTVGRSGNSMGEISYSDKDFWPLNTALYVTDFKGNDPKFLYYLLQTIDFDQFNSGSAQKSLNRNAVYPFEVEIPKSRAEQERISSVLSSLEEKVGVNQKINQTLEQMAQAIFKSWFIDFEPVKAKIAALEAGGSEDDALLAAMQAIAGSALFATDAADTDAPTQLARLQADHPEQYTTLRATAELFPSAMQESELGEIPEGWECMPLSEMVELIGGGTPKRSEPAYWNGDICWFSVKDAPNDGNVFVIDTVEKITDAGLKGSSTKLLPLGTTIITARGTVGKLALTGVVTAMNQSCYGVIGIEGTGPYLNYLQMQEAVETLQRNTHGAVFDTITQATFGTVFQAQACISLRTNFENLVAPAFEMIKNNLQQIKALSELRDTLLPKLLSGELSVAEAE